MTFPDPFATREQPLPDPFEDNPYDRPMRVEDMLERHPNPRDRRPKLWLPDGSAKKYTSRPSSAGKKLEDTTTLSKWETRVSIDGMVSYGHQSDALQAEWAGTGPEDRDRRNELAEQAKGLVETSARVGTALHTLTERYDGGLDVRPSAKHRADLEEWKRLTRFFEIAAMGSGRPAIEVFVAMNALRPPIVDIHGELKIIDGVPHMPVKVHDGSQYYDWVRYGGTFDRIWRYIPCDICGCRNYVGDLKSGQIRHYAEATFGVQTGIYSGGEEYVPVDPDGDKSEPALRYALPDTCRHKGIIVYLPSGTGHGVVKWVNLAQGFDAAIDLVPRVNAHRRLKNWMAEFTPVPDVWAEVDNATNGDAVRALWKAYPDPKLWTPELIAYAAGRAASLDKGEVLL